MSYSNDVIMYFLVEVFVLNPFLELDNKIYTALRRGRVLV